MAARHPRLGVYRCGDFKGVLSKPSAKDPPVFAVHEGELWSATLHDGGSDDLTNQRWQMKGDRSGELVDEGQTLKEFDGETLVRTWVYCRLSENCEPPSTKFPSRNFFQAVILKNPEENEEGSPDTDTLVKETAGCALPEGPILRQIELVKLYTGNSLYRQVNTALRDDDFVQMRYYAAYIKELRDVFLTDHDYQIIKPFEGTVWRGIGVPGDTDEWVHKYYQPKSQIVWTGFTSTAKVKEKAWGGGIVFEIRCYPPPGTYDDDDPEYAPADVCEFSCYPSEDEVLFPPNVRFTVAWTQKEEDGTWLVVCNINSLESEASDGLVQFGQKVSPWGVLKASLDSLSRAVKDMDQADEKQVEDDAVEKPKDSKQPQKPKEAQQTGRAKEAEQDKNAKVAEKAQRAKELEDIAKTMDSEHLRFGGPLPNSTVGNDAEIPKNSQFKTSAVMPDSHIKARQGRPPAVAAGAGPLPARESLYQPDPARSSIPTDAAFLQQLPHWATSPAQLASNQVPQAGFSAMPVQAPLWSAPLLPQSQPLGPALDSRIFAASPQVNNWALPRSPSGTLHMDHTFAQAAKANHLASIHGQMAQHWASLAGRLSSVSPSGDPPRTGLPDRRPLFR
mmetsp:Transcript_10348/g.18433  ORF Transcript_10348/g.18433 Transcript_10348/m.18433 type:complete len:618 (+) Transcript_10348:29-1882(+)